MGTNSARTRPDGMPRAVLRRASRECHGEAGESATWTHERVRSLTFRASIKMPQPYFPNGLLSSTTDTSPLLLAMPDAMPSAEKDESRLLETARPCPNHGQDPRILNCREKHAKKLVRFAYKILALCDIDPQIVSVLGIKPSMQGGSQDPLHSRPF